MSDLQTLQQQMLRAVLAHRSPRVPALESDDIANAETRLAVYRHGYRIRLREALATEFPGLALLASRRFAHLLDSYIEAHPSGHFNIRWHGAGVAAFLEYALPWRDKPALTDMALLDWAISTTFDAADETTIGAPDLASVPPEAWMSLTLHPQANLQILATRYNIEDFRRAADSEDKRPHLRRYTKPRHMLVWRQNHSVHYRSIANDERVALQGAIRGESFATLCEHLTGYHRANAAMSRMVPLLHQWLGEGLVARLST